MLTFALNAPETAWGPPLSVISVVCLVSSFGVGLGPVPPLLPAELFPAPYRAAGSGVTCNL